MLYIRPTSASDACDIKAVTFGNEFPFIRTQSLIRRTLRRKPLVLSPAPIALLQPLHYWSEYERPKTISHTLPVTRALSVPPRPFDEGFVRKTRLTASDLLLIFRGSQIGDAPHRRRDLQAISAQLHAAPPTGAFLARVYKVEHTPHSIALRIRQ